MTGRHRRPFDVDRDLRNAEAEAVIRAAPALVARAFADPAAHAAWGLWLRPYEDRGDSGVRCTVRGPLVGSVEWWLDPLPAPIVGVQAHLYLRVAATSDGDRRPWPPGRVAERLTRLRSEAVLRRWRHWAVVTKSAVEPSRR